MKLYPMRILAALAIAGAMLTGCDASAPTAAPDAASGAKAAPPRAVAGPERRILAVGDSLFAGYGLSPGQGYPARLEAALRKQGLNARVASAAVSGDTSADIRQRIGFALDNQPARPDLVIVELGGNDMLRGVPPVETHANLDAILADLKARKLPVLVMGMLAAPNLGADYRAKFDAIYPALAKQYDAALVPFFLQAAIGKPELVQADHVHPTAAGIDALVADTADDVAAALR